VSDIDRASDPESEYVAAARQGDQTAWEALVSQHQEPVFRLAYLLMGDADEAADVAQETFIRAYRAIGRFDASRSLRPWLLSIATNVARNRRRSLGRYVAALRRLLLAEPPQPKAIAERSLQRMEAQALWRAVQRLSRADQEVIYLRYYLDLSEADMAHTLQVAQGTVKSRLHRALGRLRTVVTQEFPLLGKES
jgi:RNA polymerase sigma-70 factor (ECF subfamily)